MSHVFCWGAISGFSPQGFFSLLFFGGGGEPQVAESIFLSDQVSLAMRLILRAVQLKDLEAVSLLIVPLVCCMHRVYIYVHVREFSST